MSKPLKRGGREHLHRYTPPPVQITSTYMATEYGEQPSSSFLHLVRSFTLSSFMQCEARVDTEEKISSAVCTTDYTVVPLRRVSNEEMGLPHSSVVGG